MFSSLFAQDDATTKRAETDDRAAAAQQESKKPAADKPDSKEKLEKATIALSAVVGIAILGVGAIAGVMLGAKYLRRIARDAGPPQRTVGNDFWFLKPPKPHPTDDEHMETHRPTHTPPETETRE